MKKKAKKVVLFLVEGASDLTSLEFIDFINNKELSFYESVKLLNKKYKIGLVNAYSVVNCLREM